MSQKFRFLWNEYLREHKKTLIFASLAGGLAAWTATFGFPFMVKKVFPVVFGKEALSPEIQEHLVRIFGQDNLQLSMVWLAASYLPIIMLICGIASFINNYYLASAGLQVLEKMRLRVYTKYQELPLAYHEGQKRGDLLSRLMHDCQFLQEGMLQITNDLVIQPMTLLGALGYLTYAATQNQQFLILMVNILLVGACVLPVQRISRKMLSKARQAQAGMGDIMSTMQENLASQRDIRAFEMEKQQVATLRQQIGYFFASMLNIIKWQNALTPIIEVTSAIALSTALFIGSRNGMELEDFISLAIALYFCYEPVKKLGAVHNRLNLVSAGIERINEVIYTPDEMPDPANPVPFAHCRGDIRFDHVSFAYNQNDIVLHDINIHIPAGQVIAIVGPSGSGKTTFANLVCRFYDVTQGEVLIDGINVKDVRKKDLMNNIALVSQFPVLFKGTIADNIRIGKPGASDEEVAFAAHQASVDSFADPATGYKRAIGEAGEGLSGGQRQRVSIARAFLKNSPILILDEATASLDMKSEELIQGEIDTLAQNRTSIIIAHRFSTIRKADRILVLEQGRIIGDGTHDELYTHSPLYRDLYDKQIMN